MESTYKSVALVLGNLSLLCSFILALAYINNPSFRKPPGNLAMWQFIFQTVYSLHWITSIPQTYNFLQGIPCQIISVISFFSIIVSWNYLVCTELQICIAIKSMKPYSPKRNIIWHIWSILSAFSLTFYISYHTFDKNLPNTCAQIDICFFYSESSCIITAAYVILSAPLCLGLLIYSWNLRSLRGLSKRLKQFQMIMLLALLTIFPTCIVIVLKSILPIPWPDWAQLVRFMQLIIAMVASFGIFNFLGRVYKKRLLVKVMKAAVCIKEYKENSIYGSLIQWRQERMERLSLFPIFQSIISVVKSIQNIVNMLESLMQLFRSYEQLDKLRERFKLHQQWKFIIGENTQIKLTQLYWKKFQKLRKYDKVSNRELLEALQDKRNLLSIQESSKNPGGNGFGFMFFTKNNRFILKTLNSPQIQKLEIFMDPYYNKAKYNKTLISRIYGLFQIKNQNLSYYLVILENVHYSIPNSLKYDLKGSEHHRKVSHTFYSSIPEIPVGVYKDIDFFSHIGTIHLQYRDRKKLLKLIQSDAKMCSSLNIMDYSLLVGIAKDQDEFFDRRSSKYRFKSWIHGEEFVCYIAIIDFLQSYNIKKKVERSVKGFKTDKAILSVQPPAKYSQRFVEKSKAWFSPISNVREYIL